MMCKQIIDGGQYIPEQCVDCKLKEACRKGACFKAKKCSSKIGADEAGKEYSEEADIRY